jgi:hypothetical protein
VSGCGKKKLSIKVVEHLILTKCPTATREFATDGEGAEVDGNEKSKKVNLLDI